MDRGPMLTFEGSVTMGVLVNPASDTVCVFHW